MIPSVTEIPRSFSAKPMIIQNYQYSLSRYVPHQACYIQALKILSTLFRVHKDPVARELWIFLRAGTVFPISAQGPPSPRTACGYTVQNTQYDMIYRGLKILRSNIMLWILKHIPSTRPAPCRNKWTLNPGPGHPQEGEVGVCVVPARYWQFTS